VNEAARAHGSDLTRAEEPCRRRGSDLARQGIGVVAGAAEHVRPAAVAREHERAGRRAIELPRCALERIAQVHVGGRSVAHVQANGLADADALANRDRALVLVDHDQPVLVHLHAGQVEGPRMYVAGAYVTAPGGGGEVTGLPDALKVPEEMRRGVASNADEVRQRVRELLAGGADFIKVIATGAVFTSGTTPSMPEFTEEEIRAAVEEAAKAGTFVAAHAHGAEGIKNAVRAGVRTIEHGSYLDDEGIQLMLQHGTWLVADIYNGDYTEEIGTRDGWPEEIMRKNRETTDIQRQNFAKAVKAGVRVAFGTDSGIYPHGDNARQFPYMVKYGLSPLDAIRAATISAAASLGRSQELGSIAPGKFGDMIAIDGDPIADINRMMNVVGVIKEGELVHEGNAR